MHATAVDHAIVKTNIHKSLSTRFTWKRKNVRPLVRTLCLLIIIITIYSTGTFTLLTSSKVRSVLCVYDDVDDEGVCGIIFCFSMWMDRWMEERWRFIYTYIHIYVEIWEYVVKQSSFFKSMCWCKRHLYLTTQNLVLGYNTTTLVVWIWAYDFVRMVVVAGLVYLSLLPCENNYELLFQGVYIFIGRNPIYWIPTICKFVFQQILKKLIAQNVKIFNR